VGCSNPRTASTDRIVSAEGLLRRIIGFHRDDLGDWVADLECGHGQHVRHDPPWQVRPWVVTDAGRAAHIGTLLYCVKCVATPPSKRE
jgi:hypothetical protein